MDLTCAIVDDEPLATRLLAEYVQKTPGLQLLGKCNRPSQLLALLAQQPVDLLFLDIQMPEMTGLDLLKTLKNRPLVILTSAYSHYAVEGFALEVTDYLLKPITFERFGQAVVRASELLRLRRAAPATAPVPVPAKDYLLVKADQKIHKVHFNDILYIEGLKEYVSLYTTQHQRLITLEALKNLEEMLPCPPFVRCHKSYIVSLSKVSAIVDNHLEINKKPIPIGPSYREQVWRLLS
jgi:DNA-binding LytR/AlgR family response regulator